MSGRTQRGTPNPSSCRRASTTNRGPWTEVSQGARPHHHAARTTREYQPWTAERGRSRSQQYPSDPTGVKTKPW